MKVLIPRIIAAVLTFMSGAAAHKILSPSYRVAQSLTRSRAPELRIPSLNFTGTTPLAAVRPQIPRRISQEAIVTMPKVGKVHVRAFEPLGDGPETTFTQLSSGKEILSNYLSNYGRNDNSQTRFKTISIKSLPTPLIINIGVSHGGSDSAWEASAVGVVNGQLEVLTYEHLRTSNEGGFFFGDLGHGLGLGAAQWDFVWGEDEAHVSPHRYEVTLYKWSGWRLEWFRVFRTRSKYNSGRAALRAYDLHYADIRKSFPEWSDVETW